MEYNTRILSSELNWYENGDLVKNPEFSANMEVIQRGINENYNEIQDLQAQAENFVEIDNIVAGDNIEIEKQDIVSLAKRLEEVFLPNQSKSILLPRESNALYLIQRIRDEAHRFAITFHRELRSKAMKKS